MTVDDHPEGVSGSPENSSAPAVWMGGGEAVEKLSEAVDSPRIENGQNVKVTVPQWIMKCEFPVFS